MAITSAIKSKAITSALTTYALCLKHNILHILTVLTQFGIHCQYNNSIIKQNYRYKHFPIQFWPSCIARRTFSLRPEEAHSSERKLVFQLKKIFCFKRKSLLHLVLSLCTPLVSNFFLGCTCKWYPSWPGFLLFDCLGFILDLFFLHIPVGSSVLWCLRRLI